MPNQIRHRRAQPRTTKVTIVLLPEEIAAINTQRQQSGLSFDRQLNRLLRQQVALNLRAH